MLQVGGDENQGRGRNRIRVFMLKMRWEGGVVQLGADKKIPKEGAASTYLDNQISIEIGSGSVEAGALCPFVRRGFGIVSRLAIPRLRLEKIPCGSAVPRLYLTDTG